MNTKKIKELVPEYTYNELGFPIVLHDVTIVEDRGYEYPLINHNAVILQTAYSLVTEHQGLDGARLKFIRRFMSKSLDQFTEVIGGISKSTLHNWEKEKTKVCELSDEQLRSIYLELRNEIIKQIGAKMDKVLVKDFLKRQSEIPPLSIEKNHLVAI